MYVSNQDAWYARVFVHATLARRRPIRNHAINRSFDRASIHQQKVNTQNGLPSDAPPTPTPTTRLAGRVRIIRASSSRACLFALERRRHHACIHPRASSCIIIPSITTSTQRATPTTRLSSTGRVRRHRTSDVTCARVFSRIDACASSPVASVGLVPRHTRTRSFRARDRDWTGQRRRRRRARSTTRPTRETWWWGLVLIPRARRSSSRRRRCVGGADSIRACVRCHAKSIVVVDAVRACGGVCVRGVVARGWGRWMRAWCA